MNKMIKLTYLILILVLNFSCLEKKIGSIATEMPPMKTSSTADTLKFTSGIRAIFQDSKGNYWFGSKEGIAMFNGTSFSYLSTNDGLPDDNILAIQEDHNGNIWIESQEGISSYNGSILTNHTKSGKENSRSISPFQVDDFGESNWIKSEKDLWFGAGSQEGVYRFDGRKLNFLAFPNPKVVNPDNFYGVTGIAKGKDNMIWFGTYAGVFGYDGGDFMVINDETLGHGIGDAPLHIRSILEDSKGRLWIGNNGIGVLLKEGDEIIQFSERNNLVHPTSGRRGDKSLPGTLEHVFTMAEDGDGHIWFGDRDSGLWKYDGQKMINYTTKDGLANDFALSIFNDHKGELWFGMADGKVYKFNGQTFERQF